MSSYTLGQLLEARTDEQVTDIRGNILRVPHPFYRTGWMKALEAVYDKETRFYPYDQHSSPPADFRASLGDKGGV